MLVNTTNFLLLANILCLIGVVIYYNKAKLTSEKSAQVVAEECRQFISGYISDKTRYVIVYHTWFQQSKGFKVQLSKHEDLTLVENEAYNYVNEHADAFNVMAFTILKVSKQDHVEQVKSYGSTKGATHGRKR